MVRVDRTNGVCRQIKAAKAKLPASIKSAAGLSARSFIPQHEMPILRECIEQFEPRKQEFLKAYQGKGAPPSDIEKLSAAFDKMAGFYTQALQEKDLYETAINRQIQTAMNLLSTGFSAQVIAASFVLRLPAHERQSFDENINDLVERFNTLNAFSSTLNDFSKTGIEYSIRMLLREESSRDVWALKAANDSQILRFMGSEHVQKIAKQTYYITSTVLTLFDLEEISMDVGDLALMRIDPVVFEKTEAAITEAASKPRDETFSLLGFMCEILLISLKAADINCAAQYGVKRASRAHKKLEREGESLTDAARFRIIIDGPLEKCKEAFLVIELEMGESGYTEDLSERKNYVKGVSLGKKRDPRFDLGPKDNSYESIHLLYRRHGTKHAISIQIRTKEMHEKAEKGPASHSSYKTSQELSSSLIHVDALREQIIKDREIYTTDKDGIVYRLVPYPKESTITIADLAFAISPKTGLICPNFVPVERFDAELGFFKPLTLSLFEPLKNGDRVLLSKAEEGQETKIKPILKRSAEKLGTIAAKLIVQFASSAGMNSNSDAALTRSGTIKDIGYRILGPHLITIRKAIQKNLEDILRLEREDPIPPISAIIPLDYAANLLGLQNRDGLHLAVGLMPEKRGQLVNDVLSIIRCSNAAIAYKLSTDRKQAKIWILANDAPNLLEDVLSSLKVHSLDIARFNMKKMQGGLSLLFATVSSEEADLEAQIAGRFERELESLYGKKTTPQIIPSRRRTYTLNFNIKNPKYLSVILKKLSGNVASVSSFRVFPEYSIRGTKAKIKWFSCELTFLVPFKTQNPEDTEAKIRKILQFEGAARITLAELK